MRMWTSILAGLQIFSAGTILTEVFPARHVGVFILLVAALQGGTTYYMRSDQGNRPEIDADGGKHAWRS